MIDPSAQKAGPLGFDGEVGRFAPQMISKRMAEQQGAFTVQGNPLRDLRDLAGDRLVSQSYTPDDRREILIDLFRLGVTASSLFRDLPGLAQTVRWVHEEYVPRMSARRGDD